MASPTPTTILSLQLPAGSYWITGKLLLQSSAPTDAFRVDCDVVNGPTQIDFTNGTLVAGAVNNVPLAFGAPLTLGSPGTVTLACDSEDKPASLDQAIALGGKLAAIQVQNLTQSQ